jgi:LPXTG-motif cell wall-anchored protein
MVQSEEMNKLTQVKKLYQTEIHEKSLSEEEKIKRYKLKHENESNKYEIEIKMSDSGLQLYKQAIFKYYLMSKKMQDGRKKKIYKIKKNTKENNSNADNSNIASGFTNNNLNKLLLVGLPVGLAFAYLIFKKKKRLF